MATTRTQAERSATTRQALLDATIRCLVEDGYANTTTARVAERAGVSRGAHLHHFQTRQALVAAAAERLTMMRREQMLIAVDRLPEGRERFAAGLDLLWATYADPLYQAALVASVVAGAVIVIRRWRLPPTSAELRWASPDAISRSRSASCRASSVP